MNDLTSRLTNRSRRGRDSAAFATFTSPLGDLLAVVTEEGLHTLAFSPDDAFDVLERLAFGAVEDRAVTDAAVAEIQDYLAGRRRHFDLDVDWTSVTGFARRVLEATAAIPYGEVRTYAEVAAAAGRPGAARAAGNALASNRAPVVVPCHRVVRSGGDGDLARRIGGYAGGAERKRRLLELEGVLTPGLV